MILMMVVALNKIIFYENTISKTGFEGVWKIGVVFYIFHWHLYCISKAFLLHILSFVICIVLHSYTI